MSERQQYKRRSIAAILLETILTALFIAALATPYYNEVMQYNSTPVQSTVGGVTPSPSQSAAYSAIPVLLNSTALYYYAGTLQQILLVGTTSRSALILNYSNYPQQYSIFQLIFAANLIALIISGVLLLTSLLLFVDVVRNHAMFHLGYRRLRIGLVLAGLAVLAGAIVAFLALLGITQAMSSDVTQCSIGACQRFSDSTNIGLGTFPDPTVPGQTDLLQKNQSWGPDAAWFIVLTCIPLSILLVIVLMISKMPIPTDEASIDPISVL